MARLTYQAESGLREFVLKPGTNNVGRLSDNDVVIPDGTVSKKHCQIEVHDWGLLVRDLGSTNGTFVDSHAVTEAAIKPGQKIRLGTFEMLYAEEHAASPVVAKAAPVRVTISASSSQTTMLARPETKPSPAVPPVLPSTGRPG
jgi:pSer/pThr/pTyr-binding forkhead associated (FHA) protein